MALRCTHPTFGAGTITRLDGDKAEVRFDSGATKLLARRYLREG